MADEALKRVKSDVRSVLLSAPRGVLKRSFRREYMSLVGQDVPFAKLGFRSMEDFVKACPDVVKEGIGPTGEPTYFVVANAETQHVASLVARQKKPRLKVLRKATPIKRGMFQMPSSNRYRGNRSKPQFRPTPAKTRHLLGNPVLMNSMAAATQANTRSPSLSTRSPLVRPAGAERSPIQNQPPSLINSPSANKGIPPWKDEYRNAITFTSVEQLIRTKEQHKDKMICVSGFPGNHDTITQYDKQFRILLFNDYTVSKNPHLRVPVLNTFFGSNHWNIKEYRDPYSFPARGGWKIKIWGQLQYKIWQNKGDYTHSLKAVYYEKISFCPINRSVSNGHQDQLKITVSGNSLSGGRADSGKPFGAAVSPSMQRLSSSSSLDSNTEYSISETSSTPFTGSLEDWVKYQLNDKPNGLWGRVLESQYKKDFKKETPPNLLARITSLPFIKTEDVNVGNPIVYLAVETKNPPIPKYVELSVSDDVWADIVVVNVENPSKFHVQCLADDCSKALERLAEDMNRYYSQQTSGTCAVTTVSKDALYGVCWTESNEWCRAVVLSEPDTRSMIYVRYPDYGNVDHISVSSLRKLPNQFYSLPLQGICCGLENFTDTSDKATVLFEKLAYEKSCSILVSERSCDQYSVDLIPEDCNVSIIDLMDQKLNPVESLVPSLPKVSDGRVSVRLVEVVSNDPLCIFVNITGKGTEKLETLLNDINTRYQSKGVQEYRDQLTKNRLTVGMMCCAQFQDEWHRVKITNISPDNPKVLVEYIDYGTVEEQDPTELRKSLEDNPLNKLPPQAVKCRLSGIHSPGHKVSSEWRSCALRFLVDFIDQQELYLEMISESECVLYDHTDTSINEQLQETLKNKLNVLKQETSVQPSTVQPATVHHSPSPISSTPPGGGGDQDMYSTTPVIPDVTANEGLSITGDVFPVNISHCVSPQNFTIQLNTKLPSLEKLQSDIQRYCRGSPPELKDCKAGVVGIGRYRDDGRWYRVILKDALRLSTRITGGIVKEVPVVFVDYGNEDCVSDVVVITKELLHQLPFQGIPAQLHVPAGGLPEWSNDQFIQRIYDRQFYCHVKGYDNSTERYSVSLMDIKTQKLITDF